MDLHYLHKKLELKNENIGIIASIGCVGMLVSAVTSITFCIATVLAFSRGNYAMIPVFPPMVLFFCVACYASYKMLTHRATVGKKEMAFIDAHPWQSPDAKTYVAIRESQGYLTVHQALAMTTCELIYLTHEELSNPAVTA